MPVRGEEQIAGRSYRQNRSTIDAIGNIEPTPTTRESRGRRRLDLAYVAIRRHDIADVVHLGIADYPAFTALKPRPRQAIDRPVRRPIAVPVDLGDKRGDIDCPRWLTFPAPVNRRHLDKLHGVESGNHLLDEKRYRVGVRIGVTDRLLPVGLRRARHVNACPGGGAGKPTG